MYTLKITNERSDFAHIKPFTCSFLPKKYELVTLFAEFTELPRLRDVNEIVGEVIKKLCYSKIVDGMEILGAVTIVFADSYEIVASLVNKELHAYSSVIKDLKARLHVTTAKYWWSQHQLTEYGWLRICDADECVRAARSPSLDKLRILQDISSVVAASLSMNNEGDLNSQVVINVPTDFVECRSASQFKNELKHAMWNSHLSAGMQEDTFAERVVIAYQKGNGDIETR